jgi:hypothetical protein
MAGPVVNTFCPQTVFFSGLRFCSRETRAQVSALGGHVYAAVKVVKLEFLEGVIPRLPRSQRLAASQPFGYLHSTVKLDRLLAHAGCWPQTGPTLDQTLWEADRP